MATAILSLFCKKFLDFRRFSIQLKIEELSFIGLIILGLLIGYLVFFVVFHEVMPWGIATIAYRRPITMTSSLTSLLMNVN